MPANPFNVAISTSNQNLAAWYREANHGGFQPVTCPSCLGNFSNTENYFDIIDRSTGALITGDSFCSMNCVEQYITTQIARSAIRSGDTQEEMTED
jgi:hypothetical protein